MIIRTIEARSFSFKVPNKTNPYLILCKKCVTSVNIEFNDEL